MEDVLVTYEVAALAKIKKFNWQCLAYYYTKTLFDCRYEQINHSSNQQNCCNKNNTASPAIRCAAPNQALLQKWFREAYDIHIEIHRDEDMWKPEIYSFKEGNKHIPIGFKRYDIYEDALEAGLLFALNLI